MSRGLRQAQPAAFLFLTLKSRFPGRKRLFFVTQFGLEAEKTKNKPHYNLQRKRSMEKKRKCLSTG